MFISPNTFDGYFSVFEPSHKNHIPNLDGNDDTFDTIFSHIYNYSGSFLRTASKTPIESLSCLVFVGFDLR
jgi:hypothetical protein